MSFTFEREFKIDAVDDGGFILKQYNTDWHTWAFTNLEDLVAFLTKHKKALESKNDPMQTYIQNLHKALASE